MSDEEIERLARSYAGDDFRERRIVTETPIFLWSDEEWTLKEFVAMLWRAVPTQYTDSAKVSFERGSYDESDSFKVRYERPETDEEVAKRVRSSIAYAENCKLSEKETFERLKAKFENKK